MPPVRDYLKKVAATSLLNSGISAAAAALLLPFIVRHVGLQAYGLWAVIWIFVGVTSLLDFGIHDALVYWLPKLPGHRDTLIVSATVLTLGVALGFGLVLAVLLVLGIPAFGPAIAANGNLGWWIGLSGSVIVFACLLTNILRAILEASFGTHIVNMGLTLLTILQYAAGALAAMRTRDPRALAAATVAVYATVLIAHLFYVRRYRVLRITAPRRFACAALLGYGARSFVASLPNVLQVPAIMYCFMLASNKGVEYGAFDIAVKIAALSASALGLLALPMFAIAAGATPGEEQRVHRVYRRYLHFTVPAGLVGCVVYTFAGPYFLPWFFPEQTSLIYRAGLFMLWGFVAAAALEPIARLMMGRGRLGRLSVARYAMLVCTFAASVVLSYQSPLDRFALSLALGSFAYAIALLWLNPRQRSYAGCAPP